MVTPNRIYFDQYSFLNSGQLTVPVSDPKPLSYPLHLFEFFEREGLAEIKLALPNLRPISDRYGSYRSSLHLLIPVDSYAKNQKGLSSISLNIRATRNLYFCIVVPQPQHKSVGLIRLKLKHKLCVFVGNFERG